MDSANRNGTRSAGASALELLRDFSTKARSYLRDASMRTAETVQDGAHKIRSSRFGQTAGEKISDISRQAAEGGSYVYQLTRQKTQGLVDRFSGTPLQAECAREAKEAPLPRIVLLCCTSICAGGLASENLFNSGADNATAAQVLHDLNASQKVMLIPPGATPQLMSEVLKLWLRTHSHEPLLTYRLVPALTCAETPQAMLREVLRDLPAVNSNAVFMLLETCHRIASNSVVNGTDAPLLARLLAPYLLWQEPEGLEASASLSLREKLPGQPLSGVDAEVFTGFLTYMISHYRNLMD